MKKHQVACLILAAILLCGPVIPAFALEPASGDVPIAAHYTNTDTAILSLNFPNGVAECAVKIYGITGVTKISATIKLQRKSGSTYITEATWTQTTNSDLFKFAGTYSDISKGTTYRLYVTANVTKGTTEAVEFWTEGTY